MTPANIQAAGLCVSIGAPGDTKDPLAATLAAARKAAPLADVIEIRLDSLAVRDVRPFIEHIDKPLLFTNRPVWEGGRFDGPEEERLAPLLAAIRENAAYVDIELQADMESRETLLAAAACSETRILISWHDFIGTPLTDELEKLFQQMQESGAAIGKIVTMAHDFRDVLRVLALQQLAADHHFPLIAFCMGRAGVISRLATLELGGYMTYAAPDGGQGTAPGQLPVSSLRALQETLA